MPEKYSDVKKRCSGFSMIEVLIALIVLAIGLLGVAGLQTVSMQQTVASDTRSVAVMHAQSMAETIRSLRGVPNSSVVNAWEAEVKRDLGSASAAKVESVGTNSANIDITWIERESRLDPEEVDADGGAQRQEVSGSFSLTIRYRE
ncbi:hypothetical protein Q667_15575 [Marinobacter sp. C1S70]|uniref:type IV pilus modification protein PilV n=1 Tax=Marinobacter sp. C1S70 TaxID=1396859 RepID=UPI0003B9118C|nr:type IV pilus modification protein PilV [Marinobacter sp. C1S70]ERS87097.1 hypothetical protein Q667_15575 [Marinobacter sp. C1S70]